MQKDNGTGYKALRWLRDAATDNFLDKRRVRFYWKLGNGQYFYGRGQYFYGRTADGQHEAII
jgi:hypothetical protein